MGVTNKGFIINQRLTMPHLQLHSPSWYKDKIQKV